jgi:hypothetical protein
MTTKINYNQIKGAVVNVLDFGADILGTTNQDTFFQAAIDSLTPVGYGGTIFIPNGVYNFGGSLVIPAGMEGLNLVGESMTGTILQYNAATGTFITRAGAFSYSSIRNMTFKATAHTSGWCMDFNSATLGTARAITGITQADPAVVSTATTPLTGTWIYITGVVGMTQVNNNYYTVGVVNLNTNFTLRDPNTGAVVSTNYTAWGSGGTWQQVTAPELTRDLELSDLLIIDFQNGIRAGATINSRFQRMRLIGRDIVPTLTSDAIGLQIGDSLGVEATSTTIENVYCLAPSGSYWGTGLWNKYCYGLLLNNYITDACQIGLRNDASVDGFMHSETTTASIAGTGFIKIHALNDNNAWGTIGDAYGAAAGQQSDALRSTRLRVLRDPAIRVFMQTSLVFGVGYTPGAGYATLVFDANIYNDQGYIVSGAYTVPVPGTYRIFAQVAWFNTLVTNDRRLRLVMVASGVTTTISEQIYTNLISAAGAGYVYATIEGIIPCYAGSVITLQHSATTNAGSGPVADGGIVGTTTAGLTTPATFMEIAQAW